jgi:hypothetical protein
MLTDAELKTLKPIDKVFKASDRDGMLSQMCLITLRVFTIESADRVT